MSEISMPGPAIKEMTAIANFSQGILSDKIRPQNVGSHGDIPLALPRPFPISTKDFGLSTVGISHTRAVAKEAAKALGAVVVIVVIAKDENVLTVDTGQELMFFFFPQAITQAIVSSKTKA